jgi:hypothetical protein
VRGLLREKQTGRLRGPSFKSLDPGLRRDDGLAKAPAHCAGAPGRHFSLASARSASALSVFSHENAVAVCFLPAASV